MPVRTMTREFDSGAWSRHEEQPAGDAAWRVEYEGAVLDTFERNGYDDSDFFAIVWDGEKVTSVEYATTRGWTYPNTATVDATDEVRAKATDWFRARAREREERLDRAAAETPAVGKKVRVTKARTRGKAPIAAGTEGWVAAIVPGVRSGRTYSDWAKPTESLVLQVWDPEPRLVYIDEDKVEVVEPEQYLSPPDEVDRDADRMVRNNVNFRAVFEPAFYLDGNLRHRAERQVRELTERPEREAREREVERRVAEKWETLTPFLPADFDADDAWRDEMTRTFREQAVGEMLDEMRETR